MPKRGWWRTTGAALGITGSGVIGAVYGLLQLWDTLAAVPGKIGKLLDLLRGATGMTAWLPIVVPFLIGVPLLVIGIRLLRKPVAIELDDSVPRCARALREIREAMQGDLPPTDLYESWFGGCAADVKEATKLAKADAHEVIKLLEGGTVTPSSIDRTKLRDACLSIRHDGFSDPEVHKTLDHAAIVFSTEINSPVSSSSPKMTSLDSEIAWLRLQSRLRDRSDDDLMKALEQAGHGGLVTFRGSHDGIEEDPIDPSRFLKYRFRIGADGKCRLELKGSVVDRIIDGDYYDLMVDQSALREVFKF